MNDQTAGLKIIDIGSAGSRTFEEFYSIYKLALPGPERKPRSEVEKFPGRPDYRLIGLDLNDRIIGFAVVFLALTQPLALLEYMATDNEHRNKGLGAQLFKVALKVAEQRVMLVEADSERELSRDRPLRLRRKNFYLRLGCEQIQGLDYKMPQVGNATPPVMDLLVHRNGEHVSLDTVTVRSWLETLYTEVYGRSSNDAAITQMLKEPLNNGY